MKPCLGTCWRAEARIADSVAVKGEDSWVLSKRKVRVKILGWCVVLRDLLACRFRIPRVVAVSSDDRVMVLYWRRDSCCRWGKF